MPLNPLHVDEHLIVVEKPAGLLSVPGRHEADCLAARVQAQWPDARVVHRLDQATSGVWVLARGADAQRALAADFEARRVTKRYVAVVHGHVSGTHGTIDLPLAADWPNRPRQRVDHEHGRPALTHWRRIDAADDPSIASTTRLALVPLTGRSHQLRVHLLANGHPIVGDRLYGVADDGAPRLMLHAERLTLPHPYDRHSVSFESRVPF